MNESEADHQADEDGRVKLVPAGEALSDEPHEDAGSVAGGGSRLPEAALEAIQVETRAVTESPEPHAISVWLYQADVELVQRDVDELPELVSHDENFVWVDLHEYSESDLQRVARLLHLDDVAVHMALSRWQRPRLDTFPGALFVCATVARPAEEYQVYASQLDLFVGRNFLVSTHKLPLPFAADIETRTRHNPEIVRHDSAYMLYIVLDELLQHYEDLREHLQGELEKMEQRALVDTSDTFLADLLRLKRYVFALSQIAGQHRPVFQAFLRPDFPLAADAALSGYFRDLEGRLSRILDQLESSREAVTSAFDIYVSHMAHRTNEIMRVLTVVSATLLPATLVVGVFETQFHGVPIYSPVWFTAMLVATVAVILAGLGIFRWRRWI